LLEVVNEIPSTNAAFLRALVGIAFGRVLADCRSPERRAGPFGPCLERWRRQFHGIDRVRLAPHETAPQTLALVAGLPLWDAVAACAPALPTSISSGPTTCWWGRPSWPASCWNA
jgi:BirA family biotin operon repressor/biotin-[acetyl-CoA-carboxylase] ligase